MVFHLPVIELEVTPARRRKSFGVSSPSEARKVPQEGNIALNISPVFVTDFRDVLLI